MGKGKGSPEEWVAVVKPGRVLYEIEGVSEELAKSAIRLASHKLAIKTRFLSRHDSLGHQGRQSKENERMDNAARSRP